MHFRSFRYSTGHGCFQDRRARPDRLLHTGAADVLDESQAELLATSFAALADPIRLRLLSYIAASDADEVCACASSSPPDARSQRSVIT